MKKGFFAYSSKPPYCADVVESAITEINSGQTVELSSWKQLKINGKFIVNEVIKAIQTSDFFCADLTGLNDNVLFEIGYAIGINKPIWLIFDTSHTESFRRYREIDFFSTIGYSSYTKTNHVVENFYSDEPFKQNGAYDDLSAQLPVSDGNAQLLFLKNQVDTNYGESIVNSLKTYKFRHIIDDAAETKTQSLYWYLSRLLNIPAILAEFSTTERTGYEIQNSKCSLICGIALGIGLEVLMVCEEPYNTPLDYKDLLKKHKTTWECRDNVNAFLEKIKQHYFELTEKVTRFKKTKKERGFLHNISFGEYLAEHERDKLYEYYVETTASNDLVKHDYNIVVGRKGSGKTATLFYIEEYLNEDPRNHVCIIKPISFEIEGMLHILSTTPENFEKSYLIESAWKLIIYSEVARSIYERIKTKNIYSISDKENSFINFVESNKNIFFQDFYERIEANLKTINEAIKKSDHDNFKVKVSEIMHVRFLSEIRDQILGVYDKSIYVLIDNLDKSWKKEAHIEYQSRWILGLLGLTVRITKEFTSSKRDKRNIDFHLTIFLRSDIFHHILRYAREPDKVGYSKLKVEDKETLFRIVEERFVELSSGEFVYEDLWDNYFPRVINDLDIKTYIYDNIIPRPRDILFFFSKIKEIAILRGHRKFEEDDVKDAYKEYSEWVFSSILVENGITIKQMEDFMYELIGEKVILDETYLISRAENSNIEFPNSQSKEKFIDHLVSLSIIGREVQKDVFAFAYDLENDRKSKALSNKLGTNRFKIHNALVAALECEI